jgi:hypothetical protein
MQKSVAAVLLLFASFGALSVQAQVVGYLQEMKYPAELPAPGAMIPERTTYYLKIPNPFGVDVLTPDQARLKLPVGKDDASVWVDFKSAAITMAINEQLKLRGIRLSETKESAQLVLRGDVSYYSSKHPYPAKRLVLDQRLDTDQLLDGGTADASKSILRSAWDLAPAYKFRSADPVTFGVGVFSAVFDATGLTSALAKARNDDEKMKNESYMLIDCFDKETRKASSCPSEAQRLESYRRKIRLQVVEVKASLGLPGASNNDSQRVHLITRQIDSRTATEISLAQLLGSNVSELVSGMGSVQVPKD